MMILSRKVSLKYYCHIILIWKKMIFKERKVLYDQENINHSFLFF